MIYFLALIPATALTVAGYVVLVLATRTEGSLRSFGRYLGFWSFTLAGLIVLGAIFAAAHARHCGFRPWVDRMHGAYCPWMDQHRDLGPPPAGPGPGPAPGEPAEPSPPAPATR